MFLYILMADAFHAFQWHLAFAQELQKKGKKKHERKKKKQNLGEADFHSQGVGAGGAADILFILVCSLDCSLSKNSGGK